MHDTLDLARKVATLSGLGLERIDVAPVEREAFPAERGWWKVVHTRPAMGTLVSVTALARSTAWAEDAVGLAFAEMDRLIAIFSRYDSGSAVTALNAAGSLDAPPPELASVVRTSLEYHGSTGGAFDVTVAPLLALFRERLAAPVPAEPTEEEIRDRLAVVDARDVECRKGRIGLRRAGMAVTLDGIAKGFIVDAMAHALGTYGVRRYLVNAGGDIRARGTKEGRRPWTVAVRDPRTPGQFPTTLHLADGAVATSGSYEVSFDGDMRFHHIVDAKTGRSPGASLSVSVTAPTATAADVLATSVFVLGPDAGVRFVDRLRGCACLVLGREGGQWMSRRWRSAPPTSGDEAGT
jgi:thiamine biosynthesis lipoprotein